MKLAYTGRLLCELWRMARARKAYWLFPIAVIGLVLGLLITAASAGAPLLYTIF
jgi:hypothetical protein